MLAELTYHMPIFAALLILISGVLVGYALSYPFRSADDSEAEQLRMLHLRNDELESSIREQRQSYAQLEQRLVDQQVQAESIEYGTQSIASQLREHQAEQTVLQSSLDEMRHHRDRLLDELDEVRQSKVDLVNSLSSTQGQVMSSSDEIIAARETISELKLQISQLRSQQEDESNSSSRLDERNRELSQELEEQRSVYAELQSSYAVAEERINALDSELKRKQTNIQEREEELQAREAEWQAKLDQSSADREAELSNREAELKRLKAEWKQEQERFAADREAELSRRDAKLDEREVELNKLRGDRDEIDTRYEAASETIAQLRETIEALSQRSQEREQERDEAHAKLKSEQQQRLALDNMLRHKEAQLKKTSLSDSALQDAMKTVDHLQTSLDQASARLQRTTAERDDLAKELHEIATAQETANEEIASHHRAIEAIERQRDEVIALLDTEKENYRQLLTDHEHHSLLSNQSQQQLNLVESQLKQVEIERNEIEARFHQDAGQVESLREELTRTQDALEQTRNQREELVVELQDVQGKAKQYDQLVLEFDEHRQAADRMRAEFDETLEELKITRQTAEKSRQLEHDVDQYRMATEQMKLVQQDAVAELREEQARSQQLQAELSNMLASGDETEAQLNSLKPVKFELAAMQNRLQSTVEQLQRIRQERDDALRAKASTEQTVSDLKVELRQQIEVADTAPQSIDDSRLEGLKSELDATRTMLSETRSHLATTRAQLNQREGLMVTLADQKANESDRLRTEVDGTREELARHATMIDQLRRQLADRTDTIANLKQDRDEILLRLRNTKAAESAPPRFAVAADHATGSVGVEHHKTRGMIYTAAPEHADDLKLISGIAEKLESRLNEFGIYTFEQIMNWDPNAVEEFCRLLTFRDRIERDDWIGQARRLHAAKYGTQKRSA